MSSIAKPALRAAADPSDMPGLMLLGKAIDVRGVAFPTTGVPVFDLGPTYTEITAPNQKIYLMPEGAEIVNLSVSTRKSGSTRSSGEYEAQYSGSLGLSGMYEGFIGSFESSFGYSEKMFEASFYSFYAGYFQAWGLQLSQYAQLYESVKEKIEGYAKDGLWEKVFAEFGTHYVATASVGGRFSMNSRITKTSSMSTVSVAAAMKAKYEMFVSATTSFNTQSLDQNFEASAQYSYKVVGGGSLNAAVQTTPGTFHDWAKATFDFPDLINYVIETPAEAGAAVTGTALVGIWTVLDNAYWAAGEAAFAASLKKDAKTFQVVGACKPNPTPYGRIIVDGVDYFTDHDTPSLTLCVLAAEDCKKVFSAAYDYYHDQSAASRMASDLQQYRIGNYLVMVASGDSGWVSGYIDGGLIDALASFGASKSELLGKRDWREPFVLMGASTTNPSAPGSGLSLRGPSQGPSVVLSGSFVKSPAETSFRTCITDVTGSN
jgi:hypothetical protein